MKLDLRQSSAGAEQVDKDVLRLRLWGAKTQLGFVKDVRIDGENVSFAIELTTPACPVRDQVKEEAHRAVLSLPGVTNVEVAMTSKVRGTQSERKDELIPLVKHVVPVASGKGGVGEIHGKRESRDRAGPMLSKLIDKFLGGVEWGELDYLLVDLPPGTGDVQLSLCQRIPLTGAAIVSTPQDLAFKVAERAISMFTKLRTPALGLVENMSGFECRHCGNREEIFGSGGARRFAAASGIPFLGEIPLSTDIRTTSDEGNPIVQSMPESLSARAFLRVAENLAAQVSILSMGGASTDRPEIAEITRPPENEVQILWRDGHESIYTGYALRVGCRCAICIDEISGNKWLREESISKDVRPLSIDPVGRYAIRFHWSDGHSTGIYTFVHLRELCPRPICGDNVEARAVAHQGTMKGVNLGRS